MSSYQLRYSADFLQLKLFRNLNYANYCHSELVIMLA